MVLIGFLGKKHCGKDTAGKMLVDTHNFTRMANADPIKLISKELFGFTEEQLNGNKKEEVDDYWNIAPRKTFQFIGTDLIRNKIKELLPQVTDNFWVLCLERKYNNFMLDNPNGNVVITDVRYQNELDMIHKYGGIVIKINRGLSNDQQIDEHESEKHIDSINNYDYCVDNNGSKEEFLQKILDIIELE